MNAKEAQTPWNQLNTPHPILTCHEVIKLSRENMMFRLAGSLITVLILVGCTASTIAMRPESANVQIGNAPPGNGFTLLGAISAKHGGGCGLYGAQGNFEGAVNILRNKAAERGADYVQIISKEGEHLAGICLDRAYIVDGFAFKKSLSPLQ